MVACQNEGGGQSFPRFVVLNLTFHLFTKLDAHLVDG